MKDSDIMKDNVRQAKRLPIAALFHAVGDILQETVDDISKRNIRAKAIQGPANADIVSSSSSSDEDDEEEERVQTQFDDGKIDRFTGVKFEAGSLHVKTMFSDATQAWLPMSKIDIQYDARMRDFLKNFRGSPGNGNGNKVTAKMARDSWREHVRHEECLQGQEVVDVGEEAPPMQWEVVVKKEEGSTPSSKRARKSPPVGRRVKLTKITPSPADRSFASRRPPSLPRRLQPVLRRSLHPVLETSLHPVLETSLHPPARRRSQQLGRRSQQLGRRSQQLGRVQGASLSLVTLKLLLD
eukprot:jgi/Mesvir1/2596/Mv13012-RA.1